ncbi:GNAT family N-acetyltransferase [Actinopolymorpha alba]|uniref:GNAT family N-acetyltransferase n=1 Tax=Actinopolymorpha alba TaxID=533267 RepID=UPI0003770C16|nr:GNAT family N-acetyltransferase [Actinopolymorpha alba]
MAADARKPFRFTTKELSRRTFVDFERFFSQVHGCMCVLYSLGGHIPKPGRTAKEIAEQLGDPDRSKKRFPLQEWRRQQESRAMKELVWKGQAHGILVYADGEPVGWCQYGRTSELPVVGPKKAPERLFAKDPTSEWRITCFTTRMDHRRRGVATIALEAAVEAIRKRGGGWIEALPIVFGHYDPELRELRRTYGWRSEEVKEYLKSWPVKDVPGIGPVQAAELTPRTAPHFGVMSMFERLGFVPTQRNGQAGVVMRLKV